MSHRLQVLASSIATITIMAIVVAMVGIYYTSAVGVLCVLGGGLIMVWINHALLRRLEETEAQPDHYEALIHLALLMEHRGDTAMAAVLRQRAQRAQHNARSAALRAPERSAR